MVNLISVTFIKKHIKQNLCYYTGMIIMECKGDVYSNFNTKKKKKKRILQMLKSRMSRWNQNIKINETNVYSH